MRIFMRFKYLEYFILFLILIFAFLIRLYKIENPVADWHSWRQADTSSVTRIYVNEGVNLLLPRYYDISTIQTGKFNPRGYRFVEFPLYNFLHFLLYNIYPKFSLEIWGRLLSVILSIISGILIFFIGRWVENKWYGLVSSFLFLFIPFNIYYSRVILPEPLAVCLGLLSLSFFILFVERYKVYYLFFAAIFLSLGVLVKPFVLFYSIPMIFLLLRNFGFKKVFNDKVLLSSLVVFVLIIILPFVLWRLWETQFPEGIPFWKWMFNGDRIRFRPSFWRWIFGERIGHLILGGWGLVPFVLGFLVKSKNSFERIFFLSSAFYLILVATANVRHDYYQTLIIPSISLILARGSFWMFQTKCFNKVALVFVLFFCLGIGFITSLSTIKDFYNVNHPEIIMAGSALDKLAPKNSLVITPYNADTAFLYQTNRYGWPYLDRSVDELIEKGAEFYVSVNFDSQTKELSENFELVKKTDSYIILDLKRRKI